MAGEVFDHLHLSGTCHFHAWRPLSQECCPIEVPGSLKTESDAVA
ncbi:MAG: hypothetical protein AAF530_00165 [Pseudomonadota bacterium]